MNSRMSVATSVLQSRMLTFLRKVHFVIWEAHLSVARIGVMT